MARLKPPILTGKVIGKWLVGDMYLHETRRERMYKCVCECGNKKSVKHTHLINGNTTSCGCNWTKHGMSNTKEYRVWDSMVRRCHNKEHKAYKDYGNRGIFVCEKWLTFKGFFEDMGLQPKGMTIERKNNSLGYFKENCKWATVTEQARNRRSTILNEADVRLIKKMICNGITQTEIARNFNVTRANIGHIAQGATWRNI